jgi:hypothetical protein
MKPLLSERDHGKLMVALGIERAAA